MLFSTAILLLNRLPYRLAMALQCLLRAKTAYNLRTPITVYNLLWRNHCNASFSDVIC